MTRETAPVPRRGEAGSVVLFPPIPKRKRGKRPPAKAQGHWPTPTPLAHDCEWGKPDRALAAFVCRSLERTMPGELWHWHKPRVHIPAALGWFIVAAVAAATLIAGRT